MKYKCGDRVEVIGEEGIFEVIGVDTFKKSYILYDKFHGNLIEELEEKYMLMLRNENNKDNNKEENKDKLIWHSYKENQLKKNNTYVMH